MIAASLSAEGHGKADARRFASVLRVGSGLRVDIQCAGKALLARAVPSTGPTETSSGPHDWTVLLSGQLHNRRAIAAELGLGDESAAVTYAAALERWGNRADEHCIGHYSAIALAPDGETLRLARSPFQAPPLHFRHDCARASAAPTPRALFWDGDQRPQPDLTRVAQALINDVSEPYRSWYHGAMRLPLGTAIELRPKGWREIWRYDLFSRSQVRLPRPQDYVEAALALLDEGVGAALDGVSRPAIMLSGGLDSALVASSALRQLPEEAPLHSFTFGPLGGWEPAAPQGQFLSDFALVKDFAAANPRVIASFETNPGRDLRYRQRDLLEACDGAPSMLGLAWVEHALYEQARGKGCDVMLCGTWGNFTFSAHPPWCYSEFLRRGHWLELLRALRARQGDPRGLVRKFLALSIDPLLPRPLWRLGRSLFASKPDRFGPVAIAPDWPDLKAALHRSRKAGFDFERLHVASKRAHWRSLLSEDGQDQDQYAYGMELLHGLPKRDPTAYRPLVEFCWGCPTEVFMREGEDRWLAREMGRGRLPEPQRTNRAYGQQYVDWQPRMAQAKSELLEEIARMEGDPDIAATVDLGKLQRLLEDLPPDQPFYDRDAAVPYQTTLPLGLAAGRFVGWAKGRNDI